MRDFPGDQCDISLVINAGAIGANGASSSHSQWEFLLKPIEISCFLLLF